MSSNLLQEIASSARLIICAGPGGVGKTTTAATIGLTAALQGRRVIVLTIDPAKRLANSLGIESLSNEPQEIDLSHIDFDNTKRVKEESTRTAEGDHGADVLTDPDTESESQKTNKGKLWAMMLDQQETMDALVNRFAPDEKALKKTRSNNIYRLMSSTLSGMQEYMALDKLYDLYTNKEYDLVVLDTPPTKNALEFLETPRRASTFFDERILKWFLPNREKEGFLKRFIGFDAGSVVLTIMRKIFGKEFIDELIEFFDTLYFLQGALKDRGEMIDFILRNEASKFILITSPDPRRIHEALFFHYKLAELQQSASVIILNRVLHHFELTDIDNVSADDLPLVAQESPDKSEFFQELKETYQKLANLSAETRHTIERLAEKIGGEKLIFVPMMGEDIHDVHSLATLSQFLFSPENR